MHIAAQIITIIGQAIVFMGILVICFGVYTILRLDGFYTRAVITSKVEVMGFVMVMIGALLISGFSIMSLKLLVILLFEMITTATASHAITRSAWVSGYRIRTVTSPNTGSGDQGGDDA
ncbi:cation:proton antiporter [Spirochaeta dissipatitropha]